MKFVVVKPQSSHDAFPFESRMVAEVDQQAKAMAGCFQVVVNLCSMLIVELGDGLNLHDDLFEADKVRLL